MAIATVSRVPTTKAACVNRLIATDSLERVARYATSNALIAARLRALDDEWDTERAIQAGAAGMMLGGLALASTGSRRWLALSAVAGVFLLQDALQRWCPPLPLVRHLGFRSAGEIDRERYALKAMRGDFAGLGLDRGSGSVERAFHAADPR